KGLDRATNPSGFIQFVTRAKWILDPADSENFAGNLTGNTIPGPLSGGVAPPPRTVLGQMSQCDDHVPSNGIGAQGAVQNTQANLHGLILGPTGSANSTVTLFHTAAAPTALCPAGGKIDHGFMLNWANASTATTAQDDIANFFKDGTLPPASRP